MVSDVANGKLYVYENDTLNLLLFADGVNYNKSGVNSMWALLSGIAELPPILRRSFENILFLSSWTGSNPDFNIWLEYYNKQIDEITEKGIEWRDKKFKIKVHLYLADAPARAKGFNSSQFNGKFGCIKCEHPTVYFNNRTTYPCLPNIELRTNEMYIKQVEEAERNQMKIKGIKGYSYLSKWIKIPENVIYDYMHMCLLGTFKSMFNNFFLKNNHNEPFYLSMFIFIYI